MIVERGARLILDGGVLTNSFCTDRWIGIRLEGNHEDMLNGVDNNDSVFFVKQPDDPYGSLDPDQSGIVVMKNGSVIENAGIGISTNNTHYGWLRYLPIMLQTDLLQGEKKTELNVNSLESGIYFVTIIDATGKLQWIHKFIKS